MFHRNLTIIAYQKQKLADWAFHHHLANDEVAAEVAAEQLTAVVRRCYIHATRLSRNTLIVWMVTRSINQIYHD